MVCSATEQSIQLPRWSVTLAEMNAHAGQPFDRVPLALRRRYWTVLREFLGYAFASPFWKQTAHFTRVDALARRVIPDVELGHLIWTPCAPTSTAGWTGAIRCAPWTGR